MSSGIVRGLDVRVVDPGTRAELSEGRVGEIWIRGGSVALGYWNRAEETRRTFGAATADGDTGFLRTGDLGALRAGELYVTGRIKEMIIVHGRNLYPHDIERELRDLAPAFADLPAAVFAVRPGGAHAPEEIVAVQEVRGRGLSGEELAALARTARAGLARRLGVRVGGVALVKAGRIRRTTSGKIQRTLMRGLFEGGELQPLHEELAPELATAFRSGGRTRETPSTSSTPSTPTTPSTRSTPSAEPAAPAGGRSAYELAGSVGGGVGAGAGIRMRSVGSWKCGSGIPGTGARSSPSGAARNSTAPRSSPPRSAGSWTPWACRAGSRPPGTAVNCAAVRSCCS
uniref:Uncharacterized protein n=1 Tax=Streptomyces avermitilis TaxID=33903 RepID=A0A499VYB9_STRAX|nr:hypothetical protein SAVMC3_41860 [Streptomyces avermitilis]